MSKKPTVFQKRRSTTRTQFGSGLDYNHNLINVKCNRMYAARNKDNKVCISAITNSIVSDKQSRVDDLFNRFTEELTDV